MLNDLTYFLMALVGNLFGLGFVIFLGGIVVYALWGIVLLISEAIKGSYKTSLEKELKYKYEQDFKEKSSELKWDFEKRIGSARNSGYDEAKRDYDKTKIRLESDIRELRIKNKELEAKNKDCGSKNCKMADKNVFITI